jgi:uncharacterized RDD family membrane protein YckC
VTSPPVATRGGVSREITTPEGVVLRFELSSAGNRLGALTLDVLWILLAIFLIAIAVAIPTAATRTNWFKALAVLAIFLVQNAYFAWFEIRGGGTTPGKRQAGIRVMDARGGPLRAEAVITRNLVRNVELFIPLLVLLKPQAAFPNAPGWAALLAVVWIVLFAFFPLFNRQRRRLGDLIAGTIVVRSPRVMLLADLGSQDVPEPASGTPPPAHEFRPEQLDIYGIYELQVLENVLRTLGPQRRQALETVCDRVKRKIGWDPARWDVDPERFLMDFYKAQRGRLEGRMLLGDRQEFKRVDPPPTAVD